MENLFFCTRWGSEHLSWTEFAKRVADAGYDGIESSLPTDERTLQAMTAALQNENLKFIGVHWDTVTPDFNQHRKEMSARLQALIELKPLFITAHTGKDHFNFEQNLELLLLAQELSLAGGVTIVHETHRGKFSFAAHTTRDFLEKLPWLNLTLDISHWYAVAESYLQDQASAVEIALSRTTHIHARVGFTQGPQVNDPRRPEWQEALQHHLTCWDKVVCMQKERGTEIFTFTSEFGPFPYLSTVTDPTAAFAQQWDINNYMKDLLKSRYYAE
ncbi:sugar phosphate isomerase/epimerase [Pedobacter sp. MC2016-24]|uniref:sugar phosphate isomerase/epimerase family protein n=1 Tax=Pedobacter sp. MC2016-24 TaxID=2780090 RepID=UPI00187FD990|nr:TIM barrel protein [Pedobacter sp. MC2016-24]MBE9600442.1 sugar phosphate isomerase/epimerase [Pedobacter sp. MC2016-24]